MFKRILLTVLFSLQLQANYGEKSLVDSCILKSANKIVVPDEAGFPFFNTCIPEEVCYLIPSDFSCIYYKASDGILELDPVKKANYENMLKDAQAVQDSYQESQLVNDLQNYCQYIHQTSCSSLTPNTRQNLANNLSSFLGKTAKQIKIILEKKAKR